MSEEKKARTGRVHTPEEIARYKKKFAILKGQGMLQRDISKKLGVSQKTISTWAKELPIGQYLTIRNGMQKRLVALSQDENTPAIELYNLANALTGIEKTIARYMDAG